MKTFTVKRIMVCHGQYVRIAVMATVAIMSCQFASAEMPTTNSPQLVRAGATSHEEGVVWYDDLESGWKAAKASHRPMVIFITSQRCRYCDAMKRDTWRDGGVLQRVKNGFVAIRLSPDRNSETLGRIHVPAYPTTLIGHPDGKIIAHKVGYQPPTEMHRLLESGVQPAH
ncbi:MAG: thioredoxin family protein [Planctomycetales bacterium]|nr:thioredoxin family protein [Planctomycetales bacterium]